MDVGVHVHGHDLESALALSPGMVRYWSAGRWHRRGAGSEDSVEELPHEPEVCPPVLLLVCDQAGPGCVQHSRPTTTVAVGEFRVCTKWSAWIGLCATHGGSIRCVTHDYVVRESCVSVLAVMWPTPNCDRRGSAFSGRQGGFREALGSLLSIQGEHYHCQLTTSITPPPSRGTDKGVSGPTTIDGAWKYLSAHMFVI